MLLDCRKVRADLNYSVAVAPFVRIQLNHNLRGKMVVKAGVTLDTWKLSIFERLLSQSGYKYQNKGVLTEGVTLLRVDTENVEALGEVIKAAELEAKATGPVKVSIPIVANKEDKNWCRDWCRLSDEEIDFLYKASTDRFDFARSIEESIWTKITSETSSGKK